MLSSVLVIVGMVLALAATIIAWIMIVPERKRAGLNKFFQYLHDLFNFKSLWLEKILKFLYIFETMFCIIGGFLMLFSFETYTSYGFYSGSSTHTRWNGWIGILMIVFGPIVVRVLYEFIMLLVLQVKNTMEINDKLNAQPGSRFEEKLIAAQKREEELAARRAEQQAAKEAYAQQQQYQQYQQYQQAQQAQQQYQQQQYMQYQQAQQQTQQPETAEPAQTEQNEQ